MKIINVFNEYWPLNILLAFLNITTPLSL